MKKITALKPGTKCADRATGLEGTITHWICNMGNQIEYVFQPTGLNPEDGTPISRYTLEAERLIKIPEGSHQEYQIPTDILGTQVTDVASSYVGMAIGFVLHTHGCFHVMLQAAGTVQKTGSPIRRIEADLRGCEGDEVTKWKIAQSVPPPASPAGDIPEKYIP